MDKLLTNKYFCLALITALGLMAFMYNRKGGCDTERLQMIDLIPSMPSIFQKPWTDRPIIEPATTATTSVLLPAVPPVSDLSEVNGDFDRKADMYIEDKLRREGYKTAKPLKSLDASFRKYMLDSDEMSMSMSMSESDKPKRRPNPQPMDSNPQWSNCLPCSNQKFSYKLL